MGFAATVSSQSAANLVPICDKNSPPNIIYVLFVRTVFHCCSPKIQGASEPPGQRCGEVFPGQGSRRFGVAIVVSACEDEAESLGLGVTFGGSDFEAARGVHY